MREFIFINARYREKVNLTKYRSKIESAVNAVLGDADILVEENRFVIMENFLLHNDAREIGRKLASTELGDFCINRPILFIGKSRKNNTREYYLADTGYREEIDLTAYKKLIRRTVHKVVPEIKVKVKKDRYIIEGDAITKGQARQIGKLMADTELGRYAHRRVVLFEGREISRL